MGARLTQGPWYGQRVQLRATASLFPRTRPRRGLVIQDPGTGYLTVRVDGRQDAVTSSADQWEVVPELMQEAGGRRQPGPIPPGLRCTRCQVRWRQPYHQTFCRQCAQAMGVSLRTTRQADAERQARVEAVMPQAVSQPGPSHAEVMAREVMADGVIYEVVWP